MGEYIGNISDGFMVTVFGDKVGGTIGGTNKWLLRQSFVSLEGVKEQIVQIMKENPSVTIRQLSLSLDMNKSAMQRHIDALKKNGYIEREGITRGKWIVKLNRTE
ncbi:winged helix-turn-helix transcriptional regulator [uncultured Parabacteroides sp.]|uniref:winged helix-turn-helix transcriptional regulator n=1 Tax=uncultured Parabacteroides sp. TaxID=512312 RepID=UPI0025D60C76|nr:winged helix-turn-helix transcriptional regulator [uncultured Parabacteroides sp.]